MEYLGDKLTVAHTHVNQWVGTVRRSLHEALNLVTTAVAHERTGAEGASRTPFKRTTSFRHFASRSRESFRRFSVRSQQRFSSLRKRHASSDPADPDHLKQCFSRPTPASRATDTLVHDAESLYGVGSGERHSQDSFMAGSPVSENTVSNRKQPTTSWASSSSSQLEVDHHDATKPQRTASLDHSKVDMDSVDGTVLPPSVRSCPEEGDIDFSFMDPPSVLDSSALKNRVQLSRRSHRRAPTLQTQRKSKSLLSESKFAVIEETDSTWMFKDTTDEKPKKEEESEDEDEKPSKAVAQPQLLPMFPGMDPAILKGQLRKRQESDSPMEISGATHLYKSPKSSLQPGAFGGRSLPSAAENGDRSVEMSPQWLQELKSKKRLSQYDNNS